MLDTMYKNDGIGLAACQVGMLKRIIVYDIKYIEEGEKKEGHILINPKIPIIKNTILYFLSFLRKVLLSSIFSTKSLDFNISSTYFDTCCTFLHLLYNEQIFSYL